jgi:hypothetical protein
MKTASFLGSQTNSLDYKLFLFDMIHRFVLFCTNFLQFDPLRLELPPFLD